MKYLRFSYEGKTAYGILDGTQIQVLKGDPFSGVITKSGQTLSLEQAQLLPPCTPGKIIAAGLNYSDHAREMGLDIPQFPALFFKPPSAVIAAGDTIRYPAMSHQVDYEAELAVVIGKTAANVTEADAASYIFGYTCLNDVTARDLQRIDTQWTRAKSFDTFAPVGPWIETEFDASHAEISARLNGKVVQHSNTANLIFSVPVLVSLISQIMTLYPGDIISTGTPGGIGSMQPGDLIEVEVAGIGILQNRIKEF